MTYGNEREERYGDLPPEGDNGFDYEPNDGEAKDEDEATGEAASGYDDDDDEEPEPST